MTSLRAEDRMGKERIEFFDQQRFPRGDKARTGRFPHSMEGLVTDAHKLPRFLATRVSLASDP